MEDRQASTLHRRRRGQRRKPSKGTVIVSPIPSYPPEQKNLRLLQEEERLQKATVFRDVIRRIPDPEEQQVAMLQLYYRHHNLLWTPIEEIADERHSVIKKLVQEGYRVLVLKPINPTIKEQYLKKFNVFIKKAKSIGAEELPSDEPDLRKLQWTRDHQSKIGSTVFVHPAAQEENHFKKAGDDSPVDRDVLGEGGKSVHGKGFSIVYGARPPEENTIVLAGQRVTISDEPIPQTSIEKLEKQGRRVYSIPGIITEKDLFFKKDEPFVNQKIIYQDPHIDTNIGLIPIPTNNGKEGVMLVDKLF